MASSALLELREQRIPEVRSLLALRPTRQLSDASAVRGADAVNRASVVVLTAHLEGYVEDLVSDVVDELNRKQPVTADIPLVLLAEHVTKELDTIADMQDRDKRAHRVATLFRGQSMLWLDPHLSRGALDANAITAGLSNPGAKEIGRVFGLLGMTSVFSSIELSDGASCQPGYRWPRDRDLERPGLAALLGPEPFPYAVSASTPTWTACTLRGGGGWGLVSPPDPGNPEEAAMSSSPGVPRSGGVPMVPRTAAWPMRLASNTPASITGLSRSVHRRTTGSTTSISGICESTQQS